MSDTEKVTYPRPAVGVMTDPGRVRANNEDSNWVSPDTLESSLVSAKGWLYIVADGMGGYQGGEVASAIVVKVASDSYYSSSEEGAPVDIAESLRKAVLDAQSAVLAHQSQDSEHSQMGSTLVMAVIHGADLYVANLGDSRCYRLRGSRLEQLTHDHSWVAEQVRNGLITPEEARHNMNRSLLTRALGQSTSSVKPEVEKLDWHEGDRLLLCCDGLWDMVPDENIRVLLSKPDVQEAASALVEAANAAGGADNITAVVVGAIAPTIADAATAIVATSPVTARLQALDPPPAAARRPSILSIVGIALVIVAVIAVIFAVSRINAPAQGGTPAVAGGTPIASATAPATVVAAVVSATEALPTQTAAPSPTSAPIPTSTMAGDASPTATAALTPTIEATQSFSEAMAASTVVATDAAPGAVQATTTPFPTPAPSACITTTVNATNWQWNPAATGVKVTSDGIAVWGQAHIATRLGLADYLGVDSLQAPFTITVQTRTVSNPVPNDLWLCFQNDINSVRCTNLSKGASSVVQVDATANTWAFEFPVMDQPQLPQLRVISLSRPSSPITITGIVYCPG